MTQTEKRVSFEVMAQVPGQNITVTFADGTSFTGQYVGCEVTHGATLDGDPDMDIWLNLITPVDAEVNVPPCNDTRMGMAGWPCVLPDGHTEIHHQDREGDLW